MKLNEAKNWIQKAIKHLGMLTNLAKKQDAITSDDTIKVSWLKDKAKNGNSKIAKRARLALTLRKFK
jgi:hypothetical protein